jgi:hypothetical protein
MMHAEKQINNSLYKEWINSLDKNKFINFMQQKFPELSNALIEQISYPIKMSKEVCNIFDGNEEDCLSYQIRKLFSPAIFECYYKFDNSTLAVANLYETLIVPSDLRTQKCLMKGYESAYVETGKIDIKFNGSLVGEIGEMSDLYWTVFYNKFIKESFLDVDQETTSIQSTHAHDYKQYLALQIWDSSIFDDFDMFVEEILYYISNRFNLNFKRAFFDDLQLDMGSNSVYELNLESKVIEKTPLLYFNSASYSPLPRIVFLAYYQAIEYFYVRANNLLFQRNLIEANIEDINNVDFQLVRKSVKTFQDNSTEQNALKLVLKQAVSLSQFKTWLTEDFQYLINLDPSTPQINPININEESKFYLSLSQRIYTVRCSIVHAKGDTEKLMLVPMISEEIVRKELPLIKFIAAKTIEVWSN